MFSDRLILFLVPILLVGIGSTAAQLNRWLARRSRAAGVAMLLLVASPGIYPVVKTPPAYREEDMKSVLAYLRTKRVPGDDLYVYYAAAPAVTFYGSMSRLTDEEYAVGGCHRGNTREYFEELDTFRGHPRVWVLMTHSVYNEREDMLRYLDSIGVRRDRFAVPSRLVGRSGSLAEAFLYDLSDSSRLSRATAASSPVTGPPPYPDVTCANGPQIMIPPRGFPLQRTR